MYHAQHPSQVPALYDISLHGVGGDPSKSPYFVRSIPVPSIDDSSSLVTRSLRKRDVGTDTNIASLVMTGVTGTISILLQAKGNHIAAASLELAMNVAANAVASSIRNRRASAVSGGVNTIGGANPDIAQAVTSSVGKVSAASSGVSSWFPSLQSALVAINPYACPSPNAPADYPIADADDVEDQTIDMDEVFVIGSDTNSEPGDDVGVEEDVFPSILNAITMTENPWAEDYDE